MKNFQKKKRPNKRAKDLLYYMTEKTYALLNKEET